MIANIATPANSSAREPAGFPILLYDGNCGLCARSVQWVLSHERTSHERTSHEHALHEQAGRRRGLAALRFATLEGRYGAIALAQQPSLRGVDSVVWLEPSHGGPSRVLVRSDAVLAVLTYVGGAWAWMARLARLVPRPSRDLLYRVVARYRYRVFGRNPSCLLPTAEQKSRFLQ